MEDARTTMRSLVRAVADAAVVLEHADGEVRIVVANEMAAEAYGRPIEALPGTRCAELYGPGALTTLRDRVREVSRSQEVLTYAEARELPGGRFVIRGRMAPLPGGRVLAVARNVSVEQGAVERVAELERLTSTGTWVWDLSDGRMHWSAELRRIVGLPADVPVTSTTVLDHLHAEDRERLAQWVRGLRATGRATQIECRLFRPDGEVRLISARGALVSDEDGVPLRLFGTVQDITEQRRLQRREQDATEAARQLDRALQFNDDVVQTLARATLALELGRLDEVRSAVRDGMATVRAIMSELLHSRGVFRDYGIRSGDLRRRRAEREPSTDDRLLDAELRP